MAKVTLTDRIRDAVTDAYDSCGYRQCSQGHRTDVTIGESSYVRSLIVMGDRYSSRCTFRKRSSMHRLQVTSKWLRETGRLGAVTFDNQLILSAPIIGYNCGGYPVFQLRLIQQSQGTGLKIGGLQVVREPDGKLSVYRERREPRTKRAVCRKLGLVTSAPDWILPDRVQDLQTAV